MNDIMKKLQREDPSRFREVMTDLKFTGANPDWFELDFGEQINQMVGDQANHVRPLDENNKSSLLAHKERLMEEKIQLVT